MGDQDDGSLRKRTCQNAESALEETVEDGAMRERNDSGFRAPSNGKTASSATTILSARNAAVLLLVSISLFLSFRIHSPLENVVGVGGDGEKDIYAIVFDAGSTGTRIHVFQFEKRQVLDDKNDPSAGFSIDLIDERFEHVEPGLSAYADDPSQARTGLLHLLQVALDRVPASKHSSTPLILKATAGLRLLPEAKADALLREVRTFFAAYPFDFDASENGDVSVLDGVDEGFYGWITVNYLLGRLGGGGGDRKEKVSTMDLGGGSTQVTFDLETVTSNKDISALSKDFVKSVDILGEEARLYTRSYLGLGIMAARLAILRKGTFRGDFDDVTIAAKRELVSPCLPPWYDDTWAFGGVQYRAMHSNSSDEFPCIVDVTAVVADAQMDKVPRQSIETSDFYCFSYYFDRLLEAGLIGSEGGEVRVKRISKIASQVCQEFPRDKRPFLCMDLSHISALLTGPGLGFKDDDKIILRKKIAGKEASWSLGSAFSLIPNGEE